MNMPVNMRINTLTGCLLAAIGRKGSSGGARAALLVFLWIGCVGFAHAETRYLSAAPDIPLFDGLAESEQDAFNFDKAEGRILSLELSRSAGLRDNDIVMFYADSLPNLGWMAMPDPKTKLAFYREAEHLRIVVLPERIELTITPIHKDER